MSHPLSGIRVVEFSHTRLPGFESKAAAFARLVEEVLKQHYSYIRDQGEDIKARLLRNQG